jgi:hypothetical protein
MLPYIDERAIIVNAAPMTLWEATVEVVCRRLGGGWRALATGLGCAERTASGDPRSVGAAVPGFRVVCSHPPTAWVLAGEHRFARYTWSFFIESIGHGRSRLRAETRAAFPGVSGSLYRGLVISTHAHAVAVRQILHMVKRGAEQPTSASNAGPRP